MVGMHDVGFDRLLAALDAFAGSHPEHEVRMQVGYTAFRPAHAQWFPFKPGLVDDIRWADVIVSHGSVCILDALREGRKLVVVPRLARYGEILNDHQVDWSTHFARRFRFPIVMDVAELEGILLGLAAAPPAAAAEFRPTGLYRELETYLDSLA